MERIKELEPFQKAFDNFRDQMEEKYRPWLYEMPLFLDSERVDFLKKSQDIMLKLMRYIAEHYADVAPYMPHDEEVKGFLTRIQHIPFKEGTFRTDFVVNETNEIRLIEVTCRFPLNGFFRSIATNELLDSSAIESQYGLTAVDYRTDLLAKFSHWMEDAKRLIIIRGKDQRDNESKYMATLLPDAQIELQFCTYEEWLEHGKEWLKDAAIMAELTFEEWLAMPLDLVEAMMTRPFLNDPRIVLAVHDKGFFGLVNRPEITSLALSAEETAFIQKAFAETYFFKHNPEMVQSALERPEQWILKPRRLGRSVNIVAGSLATPEEWEATVRAGQENDDMVLQRWHISKKINGVVRGEHFEDYFAGTLLYWGDSFLGPGFFRASCYPISNVKDNRMVPYFVASEANAASFPDLQWM
jgi:hypothetical protein